jgi:uncharacterized protein (DUF736 family)
MPEQYDNEGRIAIFKNDKQGNENRPDYRGKAQVAGNEMVVSLWLKTDKNGKKYMAGTIQPPRDRQAPAPREEPEASQQGIQDDVPF